MIDAENELRQGTVFSPKLKIVTPTDEDFEDIPIVGLGHTSGLRVQAKAEREAKQASADLVGEFAEQVEKTEFERRLVYWAVIYGLAVDEKPAYQYVNQATNVKLDLNHVIDYVENRLGLHHEAFREVGLEILEISGLSYLIAEKEIEHDS